MERDAAGDIYIYLVRDTRLEQVKLRTGKSVGFDFGLKKFLTASDGHDITSPNSFMQNIKDIRKKSRKELARAYRKMDNQRKDFHYKTARKLCEEYAGICLETLNMKGMAGLWCRKVHSSR